MNTTGLYPAPRNLTGKHSSLLAAHGTMKAPDRLYGANEKQPAEADQVSPKFNTEI